MRGFVSTYPPRSGPKPPDKPEEHPNTDSAKIGAMSSPFDVSTTGTASGHAPLPVTTSPLDLVQPPLTQLEGGFVAGLLSTVTSAICRSGCTTTEG